MKNFNRNFSVTNLVENKNNEENALGWFNFASHCIYIYQERKRLRDGEVGAGQI